MAGGRGVARGAAAAAVIVTLDTRDTWTDDDKVQCPLSS